MKKDTKIEERSKNRGRIYDTILGIPLDSTSQGRVITFVRDSLKKSKKFFVVTPNPEIVYLAQSDLLLFQALNAATIAVPDGIGLVFAQKVLGGSKGLTLIKGRDLMLALFDLANENKLKVFLLGSTSDVIQNCLSRIYKDYPNIKIKASEGPRLTGAGESVTKSDTNIHIDTIKKINDFKPDLLFIAFGAPKQEVWLYKNFNKLAIGGAMVVGGSFDYFAGKKPLPPSVLSSLGLEWLWRLFNEPGHYKRVYRALFLFPLAVMGGIVRGKTK